MTGPLPSCSSHRELRQSLAEQRKCLSASSTPLKAVKTALSFDLTRLGFLIEEHANVYSTEAAQYVLSRLYATHLDYLLRNVVVDWLPALTEEETRVIFDSHFVPPLAPPGSNRELWYCYRATTEALLILSGVLSKTRKTIPDLLLDNATTSTDAVAQPATGLVHTSVLEKTAGLLEELLKRYGPVEFYSATFEGPETEASLAEVFWEDIVAVLASLPDRAANVWGTQVPYSLRTSTFFIRLGHQIGDGVVRAASSTERDIRCVGKAFGTLIGKICRKGYTSFLVDGLYSGLLSTARVCLGTGTPSRTRILDAWAWTTVSVPDPDKERLLEAMLRHVYANQTDDTTDKLPSTVCGASFLLQIFLGTLTYSTESAILPENSSQPPISTTIIEILTRKFFLQKFYPLEILQTLICLLSGAPGALIKALRLEADGGAGMSEYQVSTGHDWSLLGMAIEVILSVWCNKGFLQTAGFERQQYISQALLICLAHTPNKNGTIKNAREFLRKAADDKCFVEGVGNYLECSHLRIRTCGLIVAEILSRRIQPPTTLEGTDPGVSNEPHLDFGLDKFDPAIRAMRDLAQRNDWEIEFGQEDGSAFVRMKTLIFGEEREGGDGATDDETHDIVELENTLAKTEGKMAEDSDDNQSLDPDELIDGFSESLELEEEEDVEEDDSDVDSLEAYPMDDEDDVNVSAPVTDSPANVASGKSVRSPVYVRDCITFLKASEDPDRIEAALKVAEDLIRKADEVDLAEVAEIFSSALLHLQDTFELANFESARRNALVALVTKCPAVVARYIAEQVFERNYNFSQRFVMMDCLALGARELSGLAKHAESEKMLSPTENDTKIAPLALSSRASMIPAVDLLAAQISTQKSRRFSRKSEISQSRSPPKSNLYHEFAGTSFLYPLMRGMFSDRKTAWGIEPDRSCSALPKWMSANKGVEPVLLEKVVVTLGVLLYCAANSHDFPTLCREFWDLSNGLRYAFPHRSVPIPVTKAILFGMGVVLEGLPPLLVARDFARDAVEIREWTYELFETTDDTSLKSQAAGLLIRLQEITEACEMQLMPADALLM